MKYIKCYVDQISLNINNSWFFFLCLTIQIPDTDAQLKGSLESFIKLENSLDLNKEIRI